jgi:hypothetical protein
MTFIIPSRTYTNVYRVDFAWLWKTYGTFDDCDRARGVLAFWLDEKWSRVIWLVEPISSMSCRAVHCLGVRDWSEFFIGKYRHALTVQWTRHFKYRKKKFRVHWTVSKWLYLPIKNEWKVSNPFNIKIEFAEILILSVTQSTQFLCKSYITMSVLFHSL